MKVLNRMLAAAAVCIASGSAVHGQNLGLVKFSAVIDRDGNTIRGSGVQSSSQIRPGVYLVTFTRDLTSCLVLGGVRGRRGGSVSADHPVEGESPNAVRVFTFSRTGARASLSFNLLVSCS